ncbi:Tyrosine-protein kinase wzc [Thiorhodovibrio winogradskyi]|uniref:non-specific protein-tyrosine kinase n=1 Tax=Thiorhodovibrio winogradskyi TaxID=77007 RepID=A0ABZ0SCA9_9GAMM|nr:XrtA-associated tyrosine autokinase [Thiorhodovibrio winogradskyi]
MSTIEKSLAKIAAQKQKQSELTPFSQGMAVSPSVAETQAVSHIKEGPFNALLSMETAQSSRGTTPLQPVEIASKQATGEDIHFFPWEKLRPDGILTPDSKRSQLAEEYRLIKRPLLMNVDKKGADIVDNANLIMVTSSLPREGKTFTAINLAMSIAMEQDRTVLLVDGDVAKPTAAKRLGIENRAGLIDLLDGSDTKISDVMVKTELQNFRVLPAGRHHDRSTELLASDQMARFMSEFSKRYPDRVVIFDSPPLLLASETAVLSHGMGQIVMVVAAERTTHHAVADGLARLGSDKIIGLILNQYRPSLGNRSGAGYGYGYGYGYGPASDAESISESRERAT